MTAGPKRFQCTSGSEWLGPPAKCYWQEKVPNWYHAALWFGRGCGFTDVDFFFGMVENNSHFLFIEWKHEGAQMPLGQELALRRLAAQAPNTVYVVEGDSVALTATRWKDLGCSNDEWRSDLSLEDICRRWWKWAEKN